MIVAKAAKNKEKAAEPRRAGNVVALMLVVVL